MKKYSLPFCLLIFLWLAGCTNVASPTPAPVVEQVAPTSNPFGLEFYIFAPGDLPDEFEPSKTVQVLPDQLANLPTPSEVAAYRIIRPDNSGDDVGFVALIRYRSPADLDTAWETLNTNMFFFESLDRLGERAGANESEVVFTNCDTVAFIYFDGVYLEEDIIPLANRIHFRLTQAPCLY